MLCVKGYHIEESIFWLQEKEDKIDELERELDDAKARMTELSGIAATAVPPEDLAVIQIYLFEISF